MNRETQTIAEVLDHQVAAFGGARFLSCDADALSYEDLQDRSARLAGGFRALGLTRGDRVAVLLENSLAFVETFFACARLGLVHVPLNIYLRGEFLRYQLENCGATAAVVDELGRSAVRAVEPPIGLKHLIVVGVSSDGADACRAYDEVLDANPASIDRAVHASDPAAIIYTSGTTGMPKGCVVPHGQFVRGVHPNYVRAGMIRPDDVLLTPDPMFHAGFLGAKLAPALACGASMYVTRRFSASTLMRTAREIDATVLYAVGPIGMLLLAQPPSPEDAAPHSLRAALLAPMPPGSQLQFEERFNVPVNAESYGQSECAVIAAAGMDEPRQRGSAGRPLPTVEVAIVDENDVPVPPDEVGELVVRPIEPDVMFKGYWRDPDGTVSSWRNLWHHTGDLARQSADGTLWIIDRKRDSMRRRGENVSSIQLEGAIVQYPDVLRVAVHAVQGEFADDEIKACIVVRPDASITPAGLFEFFKSALPYFAIPRYVEVMDELPVNAVGRIRKQLLRDRGITAQTWDFEALDLRVERDERRAPA